MLWRGREQSDNVEDRRGGGGKLAIGGGITGIIALVIYLFTGQNPGNLLGSDSGQGDQSVQNESAAEKDQSDFAKVVLKDTEDVWDKLFRDMGRQYEYPRLVLYRAGTQTACGTGQSAMGPFYCPADNKVYLDLSFADELHSRFGAPGDFAMAYVIAHEVGHHIQNLLGISEKVQRQMSSAGERESNRLSVRLELQADFLAGVWAHHAQQMKGTLEPGDIDEALGAAAAVGDDRLQSQSQGRIVPDAFTHGTSEQRAYWFRKGFETGDIRQGNTFDDPGLRMAEFLRAGDHFNRLYAAR